jgi:hypothetical protein
VKKKQLLTAYIKTHTISYKISSKHSFQNLLSDLQNSRSKTHFSSLSTPKFQLKTPTQPPTQTQFLVDVKNANGEAAGTEAMVTTRAGITVAGIEEAPRQSLENET